MKEIVMMLAALIQWLIIPLAHAADWYQAEACIGVIGVCSIYQCELSDRSPAVIYENNKAYADAKIIDQGGNRVDVVAQGSRFIFFRDREACKAYVDERLRVNKEREQKEQEKLNKYR